MSEVAVDQLLALALDLHDLCKALVDWRDRRMRRGLARERQDHWRLPSECQVPYLHEQQDPRLVLLLISKTHTHTHTRNAANVTKIRFD